MRRAKWPDILISPQVVLSCGVDAGDGCHGGDAGKAYAWMSLNDITDETCSIYQAKGHDNGLPCGNLSMCETCDPGKMKSKAHIELKVLFCSYEKDLDLISVWFHVHFR